MDTFYSMLPCRNCEKPVLPEDAKFFGAAGTSAPHTAVFLCPTCHTVAERFYQRGMQELKHIAAMLGENIRLALLRGELSFAASEPEREVTKREVLQQIVTMLEKQDQSSSSRK